MTAFITYRTSTTPAVPGSTTAKGSALTHTELDGNFKSVVTEINTKVDAQTAAVIAQDQALALAIALG